MNKRGTGYVWAFIIAIILAIIVLVLSVFFVFKQTSVDESDLSWQNCKTSIMNRANYDIFKLTPLKCTTEVIEIDFKNKTRAERVIGDEMVKCWNLVDRGKAEIFSGGYLDPESYCLFCARVTFKESIRDFYTGSNAVDFQNLFSGETAQNDVRTTYLKYLQPPIKSFGDNFEASDKGFVFRRYVNPEESVYIVLSSNPGIGDIPILSGTSEFFKGSGLVTFMIPVQSPDYTKLEKTLAAHWAGSEIQLCKHVEGSVK